MLCYSEEQRGSDGNVGTKLQSLDASLLICHDGAENCDPVVDDIADFLDSAEGAVKAERYLTSYPVRLLSTSWTTVCTHIK